MQTLESAWTTPPAPPAESAFGAWWQGTTAIDTWASLARYDIRLRYRRSLLGPWWITLSMGAMLIGLGPLYASLFKVPVSEFFPHIATGMVFWSFLAGTILDSCTMFAAAGGALRNSDCPLSVVAWRCVARNVIQLGHHMVLFIPFGIWAGVPISLETALFVPAFLLVVVNLHAMSLWLGIACARYRDVQQIVISLLTFMVFLTPVMWSPQSLPPEARLVLDAPLAVMMSLLREPLLGRVCTLHTWTIAAAWTAVNVALAAVAFAWNRRHVVFWV